MPFLYLTDSSDDDTLQSMTLVYDFYEVTGGDDTTRLDSLTYVVSFSNMITLLKTQYYCDVPLAMDVESWDIDDTVSINTEEAIIVESDYRGGRACWICQLNDGTLLSYEIDSGIFIHGEWVSVYLQRVVQLEELNFEPDVQSYVKDEGVLLSAIFVELAIIVWLLSERLKKASV